ncbi:MAG: EAL domain-containing protein [Kofleriaceae bacterium]
MHDVAPPRFTPLVELPRRRLFGFAVEQAGPSAARFATALGVLGGWARDTAPVVMIDLTCAEVSATATAAALEAITAARVRPEALMVRVPRFEPGGSTACLDRLADAGIGVAVSDLDLVGAIPGALAGAPIDLIELPADAVALVEQHPDAASYLRDLISLAHSHDWMTLAASVVTRGQLEVLERLGCDLIAGPAAGPAMTLEQATRVVTRQRPSDSAPAPAI